MVDELASSARAHVGLAAGMQAAGGGAQMRGGVCRSKQQKMCEGCGIKQASFGLPDAERKRRWCAGCSQAHRGVVNLPNKVARMLKKAQKNDHVVAQKTKLEVAEWAGGAAAEGSAETMQVEPSADAEERPETKAPPAAAAAAGSGSTAGLPSVRVGVQERFKLFISGLSRSTTEAALRSHFGGETVILLHPLLPLVGV